ncbi:ty3-gypsy retrotransposon protein [Cucumis melo var. makuwa]|uniref:Ty3-gypsy retrotransposon protein n=1 Tax=Cucumis melo var. makuwa TaxID=1194695 RepID=A0A5A7TGE2_CUCMM|nr:ty3-gypsy retrotransposon protein [Cucumis melo var. makuwa]TYK23477.1 ty3-gypsy retrotransposon protein [Cucumis melo var. makuwa]
MASLLIGKKIHHHFLSEGSKISVRAKRRAATVSEMVDQASRLNVITTTGIVDIDTVSKEVEKDELQQIIEKLKKEPEEGGKFERKNGRVLYKGRLVLPQTSSLIPQLLHTFHDSVLVEQCEICQRNKYEATKPAGVLQPLPVPDKILEDWTMDFIEGLPEEGGVNVTMVVVDRV